MLLTDLLRAAPAVLALVVGLGWPLAAALAPSWPAWYRVAAMPGLAVGAVGMAGLLLDLLHLPLSPAVLIPALVVLAAGGAVVTRLRRTPTLGDGAAGALRWVLLGAAAAGVAATITLVLALHDSPLPPDFDAAVHGQLTEAIARTHQAFPLQSIPPEQTGLVHPRFAFEAAAVVVSWLGGPSPSASMMPLTLAAVVLMPLSLAMLAFETTGRRTLAGIAALLGVGLAFPGDQVIIGRYPLVVDSTLIVPLVVAFRRGLLGLGAVDAAAMAGAATAAIWATHGLEAITAALLGAPLLAETAIRHRRRLSVPGAALVGAACLVAAELVTQMTRVPAVPPGVTPSAVPATSGGTVAALSPSLTPAALHQVFQLVWAYNLQTPLALIVLAAGVIAVLVTGRLLWALAAHLSFVAVLADVDHGQRLARLYSHVYPWNDPTRLVGLQYWVMPLIMAAGILALVALARRLSLSRRGSAAALLAVGVVAVVVGVDHDVVLRPWSYLVPVSTLTVYPLPVMPDLWDLAAPTAATLTAAALGVAALAALGVFRLRGTARARQAAGAAVLAGCLLLLALGARGESQVYASQVAARDPVTGADIDVLHRLDDRLAPASLVLTDGDDDAGLWLPALTRLTALLPKSFVDLYPEDPHLLALRHACSDPAAAALALRDVAGIFVGSRTIYYVSPRWDTGCIAAIPGVHRIAAETGPAGTAEAFTVGPAG